MDFPLLTGFGEEELLEKSLPSLNNKVSVMDKSIFRSPVILGLGPFSIMLPIIILLCVMYLQTGFSRALRSALTIGMGFIGIFLVFGLLVDTLGPAAKIVQSLTTGTVTGCRRLGWTPLAAEY